jgi:hypothetical protein
MGLQPSDDRHTWSTPDGDHLISENWGSATGC